jgi:putative transposase
VASWDITYLPSPIRGKYYYFYLIEHINSHKALGWGARKWRAARKPPHCYNAT